MPYQADYSKGMDAGKPADPFQQRLQQSAPAGPTASPGLNQASPRSNPFAKMGGMGARAAMADRAPQSPPQPPPQAPAYGVRSRQGGMQRQPMDYRRGAEEPFRDVSMTPGPESYGDRRRAEMEGRSALGMGQRPMRGAGQPFGARRTPTLEEQYLDTSYLDRLPEGAPRPDAEWHRGRLDAYRQAVGRQGGGTPPPTGMPGGIMRETGDRDRMEQFRRFGQGGGFDPIRERLMAQQGGGMPPPQSHNNPFFDRMYQQPPPEMQTNFQRPVSPQIY